MASTVFKFACSLCLLLWGTSNAWARPAQVILLRHAEKPADEADPHLSERGRARAQALQGFLSTNGVVIRQGLPAALFATKMTRRGRSARSSETLEPLARHLKVPIQTPFDAEDYALLARHVLSSAACDAKTVVICWSHNELPQLAAALGVKPAPAKWKDRVYDRAWIVTWLGEKAHWTDWPQRLLPGDAKR